MAEQSRLARNIATLYALDNLQDPEEPSIPAPLDSAQDYKLNFSREKELAETFSFLGATTDDMHKVVAVAIEENSNADGITIRLACNSGDSESHKKGLELVARRLEHIATSGTCKLSSQSRTELTC